MGVGPGWCGACRQPILWALTSNGKSQPLDPKPDPKGNVAVWWDTNGIPIAHTITIEHSAREFEQVYMPHFATCPKRKRPATKAVTEQNVNQVARRKTAEPQTLPLELPPNVIPFRKPSRD